MWHLNKLSADTINWYKGKFLDDICTSIQSHQKLCPRVKRILTDDVIEKLLTAEPSVLYPFAKSLEELIDKDMRLWTTTKDYLTDIFDYEHRLSKNQKNSYELAERIGSKTCVYCNRIYAFTVVTKDDEDGKLLPKSKQQKIIRPDFDHWLSKADHPLTSMSIYNLIPSCPICNRGIKLQREFDYYKHVHPYDSSSEPSFMFEFIPKEDNKWDLTISGGTDMELATAEILETKAVYRMHAEMEVKDILDFIKKNPPEYLKDLYEKVLGAYGGAISPEEAYRFQFGSELNSLDYLDRPLSKLKKDIITQAIDFYGLSIDLDRNI